MIYILTDEVSSGKTTFLMKVIQEFKKKKVRVSGFLSERVLKNGKCAGYDLFDLKEEKRTPFIRREGKKGWQRVGPYFFIPQGLLKAHKIILQSKKTELLVVDEVGPLELEGRGLWPALEQVIFEPFKKSLLVVRKNILKDFLKFLSKKRSYQKSCRGKREAKSSFLSWPSDWLKIFDREDKESFSRLLEEIEKNEN